MSGIIVGVVGHTGGGDSRWDSRSYCNGPVRHIGDR